MNDNGETAVIEDYDEMVESEEPEQDDEAMGEADIFGGFPLPVPFPFLPGGRRGGGARSYYAPPMAPFVTQGQLRRSLASVRRDVRGVSGRVGSLQTATARLTHEVSAQRKTNVQQAKQIAAIRAEQKKARDMSLIMTLLMQPKTTEPLDSDFTTHGATVPEGARLTYSTGGFNPLLVLALAGDGFGGSDIMTLLLFTTLFQPGR